MSVLVASLQGRFGNQCLQWLFAYAFAKKHSMRFECEEWIGERIFDLPKYNRPSVRNLPRVNELDLAAMSQARKTSGELDPMPHVEFRGYAQTQSSVNFYTKREAQSWLRITPDIADACRANMPSPDKPIICHVRRGDYAGYGYPIVALDSYDLAMVEFGLNPRWAAYLSEENPTPHSGLPDDLSFMPDFYRMMNAKTLLRANSSFSWLAALLGNGLVLSPVVEGLVGGKEHTTCFVAGNWPRFCDLDFVSDLRVST